MARDYVSVACEHQALVDIRAQLSRALLQWRIASMNANEMRHAAIDH